MMCLAVEGGEIDRFSLDVDESMLKNRNNMAHIYDSQEAGNLVDRMLNDYIPEFKKMEINLKKRYD